MIKKILSHTFQSYGIYAVYINAHHFLFTEKFAFTTGSELIPFLLILSMVNLHFRGEESALISHIKQP